MNHFEFLFSLYGLLPSNAVYAAILIWLCFAPTRRQAAIAAWLGVAFLVTAVGILS